MISRFGFGKDAVRHFGLAIILERAVETVDEFPAANCHQELFERRVSGFIAPSDGLHIPRKSCLRILRAREIESLVELLHASICNSISKVVIGEVAQKM